MRRSGRPRYLTDGRRASSLHIKPVRWHHRHPNWQDISERPPICFDLTTMIQATSPSVTLREITAETVIPVVKLKVADSQNSFVATNAVSLAQALFAPEAWYRAIYADDEIAGFVMLEDTSLRIPPPEEPTVTLWRLMIDARFQGKGIGRAAMHKIIEHARKKGFRTLATSYVPEPGNPEGFYLSLGFRHTGRVDDDEIVLELPITTMI